MLAIYPAGYQWDVDSGWLRYKRTYTDGVIPVEVVDSSSLQSPDAEVQTELKPSARIKHLELMFSNGLLVKHNNLDYAGLKELINKLESIC